MAGSPRSSPPQPARGAFRARRHLHAILRGTAVAVALLATAAIVARRPLAGWLAERWLVALGVSSAVRVDSIGFGGASAELRLGPPGAPDLTVQGLEITFAWSGLTPRIAAVSLDRPALRLRYDGRSFDFGALRPLLPSAPAMPANQAAKSLPASDNATRTPAPTIRVRDARLRIITPSGVLRLSGSGKSVGGRVVSLAAKIAPGTLRMDDATLSIASATVSKDAADRVHAHLAGSYRSGKADGATLTGVVVDAEIRGFRWSSSASGYTIFGAFSAQGRAGSLRANHLDAGDATLALAVKGTINTAGPLDLQGSLTAAATLPEDEAAKKAAAVPFLGGEPKSRAALATALREPRLSIPDFHLLRTGRESYLILGQPATLSGDSAQLTLAAREGPLAHLVGGVVRGAGEAKLSGAGLPDATLVVSDYRWRGEPHGPTLESMINLDTQFSFGAVRRGNIEARGALAWRDGGMRFVVQDCAKFSALALTSGRKTVARHARTQICATDGATPLVATSNKSWRVSAAWRGLSAQLASVDARLMSRRGQILLDDTNGEMRGRVATAALRLEDRATKRRFAPLTLSGKATVADDALGGGFTISGAKRRLGQVHLHGTVTRGRADIRLGPFKFNKSGLQPRDLSSLLAPITEADGVATVTARVGWNRRGMTSSGDIRIPGLAFTSPAGRIEGAKGNIHLTSLAPLETAPNQSLTAEKVAWVTPLTDVTATFQLVPLQVKLDKATAKLSRGEVLVAPVTMPLSATGTTSGEITLKRVDIGELIAASNLAGKVKATGRISGTIPFRYGPDGLTFKDGHVATVTPASLSIARAVWGSAGNKADTKTGAMQNFAYQALEHLAIESLEGTVNSSPDGRLHLLLKVKGRNAPERPREAKVGLFALLRGTAFDKSVPLPKGTEVNLTLDISLNFAELLAAYRKAWAESTARTAP